MPKLRAQARAGTEALDGLTRAADAAEAVIQAELEDPLNGVFNAPSNDITRPHHRSKIDADRESQAFIRARVMTQTFAQAPTAAAIFPPDRHATAAPLIGYTTIAI